MLGSYADNPKIIPIHVVREVLGLRFRLAQEVAGSERWKYLTNSPKHDVHWSWVYKDQDQLLTKVKPLTKRKFLVSNEKMGFCLYILNVLLSYKRPFRWSGPNNTVSTVITISGGHCYVTFASFYHLPLWWSLFSFCIRVISCLVLFSPLKVYVRILQKEQVHTQVSNNVYVSTCKNS